MYEQSYPLSPGFSQGKGNLDVPLQVTYCGYYYGKSSRKDPAPRTMNCWYLQLFNYRQYPFRNPQVLEVGQFILRKPDTRFLFYLPNNETVGYYWIYFTGNLAEQLLKECDLVPDRIYSLQNELTEDLRQAFTQLFREAAQKRPGYQTMIASHLMNILIQLGRGCHRDSSESKVVLNKRIEKSVLYIRENFSDSNLTVSYLAERANLSESRFRELFKESKGVSPSEYLTQTRISNACNLLETTRLSISHIASCCGYQDIAYFSRIFRQKTGVSPSDYRKNSELL